MKQVIQAPNPEIGPAFKAAMRGLCANVTMLSTTGPDGHSGMVATAVMSISMEPPLIAAAVNRTASIYSNICHRAAFVINILQADNHEIVKSISQSKGADRFQFGTWNGINLGDGKRDLPWLENAQAAVVCKLDQSVPAGSHTIFIGRVIKVLNVCEPEPLAYCDRKFGRFVTFPAEQAT